VGGEKDKRGGHRGQKREGVTRDPTKSHST
jgi:hypothetical protein